MNLILTYRGVLDLKSLIQNSIIILATSLIPLISHAAQAEAGLCHHAGIEGAYYRYDETVKGKFLMRDKGQLIGLHYAAEFQPESQSFRFSGEARVSIGHKVKYTSKSTGSSKNRDIESYELRLLGYLRNPVGDDLTLEGYSGLGTRHFITLKDKGTTTTGHHSYYRRSEYNYIPIGVSAVIDLSNDVKCRAHLEYDHIFSAMQRSHVNGVLMKHKQPHGYGSRVGMEFHIPSTEYDISYTAGIFARYWSLKDSVVIRNLYEPKNSTQEYGVRLGIIF
jgi:hypothetical protein